VERDILRASDHIEFVLKNPKAADDLLDEAEAQINSLADFPNKFKLVDDPVLASWGIHFVIVNGYLAFCVISEETHRVIVARFLFQKSNWSAILGHGFSLL
jgi:plasmid stabilization system protein ParE